jgi:hypothetical protein
MTSTASYTATLTVTPSFTATRTRTPTFTSTSTLTLPPTMTVIPTLTNTVVISGQLLINNVVIYPNPYNPNKGDLKIAFILSSNCKTIKIKIWTSGFRLIKTISYQQHNAGENVLAIESRKLSNLANGVYYVVIEAINYNSERTTSKPQILMIIR